MALEGDIIDLRTIGNIVMHHGRQVLLSLAILVVGLLAAKIAVKYIRRVLERFVPSRSMASVIASSLFVLFAVIVFPFPQRDVHLDSLAQGPYEKIESIEASTV